jgi:VanZ family protein
MSTQMTTADRRRPHVDEIGTALPVLAPCTESIQRDAGSRRVWFRALGYWGPVALYAGFIFYLSSQSVLPDTLPSFVENLGDKAHHMMTYGFFGLLWYRAFRWSAGPWGASRAVLLAILAATLYGITDEVHQSFVPLRDADPWDVAADALGAVAAVMSWNWWIARPAPAPMTESGN